jgi:hypothetical protein
MLVLGVDLPVLTAAVVLLLVLLVKWLALTATAE